MNNQDFRVICLCGSTKFLDAFRKASFEEAAKGNVVLSVGGTLKRGNGYDDLLDKFTDEQLESMKLAVDKLHLRKIEMSDEVLVLNVGGYIGESTKREIEHASALGKLVRYLEPRGGIE